MVDMMQPSRRIERLRTSPEASAKAAPVGHRRDENSKPDAACRQPGTMLPRKQRFKRNPVSRNAQPHGFAALRTVGDRPNQNACTAANRLTCAGLYPTFRRSDR